MDRLNTILNWVIIVGALIFLFRPEGPVVTAVQNYWAQRELEQTIDERWEELASVDRRIDDGEGEIRLVEFADYQCPFCRKTHDVLSRFEERHPDVGVVYRHFPLEAVHPHARKAALSSICAERQGRFRDMHERLFEISDWEEEPDWTMLAAEVGIADTAAFRRCLRDEDARARLRRDIALGRELNVQGTPTFVHREGKRSGAVSLQELTSLLNLE